MQRNLKVKRGDSSTRRVRVVTILSQSSHVEKIMSYFEAGVT